MALQVPSKRSMVGRAVLRVLGRTKALSDFTIIANVRIIIEEFIFEPLLELWAGLTRSVDQWYLTSATGLNLRRRLADFDFVPPPALRASGQLVLLGDADMLVIPGTAFVTEPAAGSTTAPVRFLADAPPGGAPAWLIPAAGGTVTVFCDTPGAGGNVAANTVTHAQSPIAGMTSVTNPLAFTGGREAADDETTRQAWFDYLHNLKSGTRGAILTALRTYRTAQGAQPIRSAALVEWDGHTLLGDDPEHPAALVIYIEDGTGTASAARIEEIERFLTGNDTEHDPGQIHAGVPFRVLAAQPAPIAVSVTCRVSPAVNQQTQRAAIEQAARGYLNQLPVSGQNVLGVRQGQVEFAQLFRAVVDVPDTLSAVFSDPVADMEIPVGRKAVPGAISVTVTAA